MKNKKSIVKITLITFLISIVLLMIFVGSCLLFFTKESAKTLCDIGLYGIGAELYSYEYDKTQNINYIAKACNIDADNEMYDKFINHYKKFKDDDEFVFYIDFINDSNYNKTQMTLLIRSSLINELNYYENKYVESLIKDNQQSKAFAYVKGSIESLVEDEINYLKPCVYLLSTAIITGENTDWLRNDTEIIASLLDYFNRKFDYMQNIDKNAIDQVYYLNFCRHIKNMGEDLLKLNEDLNVVDNTHKDLLNEKILIVNNEIMNMLGE